MSPIQYWVYLVSSVVGMFPEQVLFVYIGATVGDLAKIVSGEIQFTWAQALIMGFGAVGVVAVVVIVVWIGRRAIAKARAMQLEAARAQGVEMSEIVEEGEPATPSGVTTGESVEPGVTVVPIEITDGKKVDVPVSINSDGYHVVLDERDTALASLKSVELDIPLPDVSAFVETVVPPSVVHSVPISLEHTAEVVIPILPIATEPIALGLVPPPLPTASVALPVTAIPMPVFDHDFDFASPRAVVVDDDAVASAASLPATTVPAVPFAWNVEGNLDFGAIPPPPPVDDHDPFAQQSSRQQVLPTSLQPPYPFDPFDEI